MHVIPFQNEGQTALHLSASEGDESAVKLLHKFGASASIVDEVRLLFFVLLKSRQTKQQQDMFTNSKVSQSWTDSYQ